MAADMRVPITAERLKDIRFVGDMCLSPDGRRVAFELREWPPGQTMETHHRRRLLRWFERYV